MQKRLALSIGVAGVAVFVAAIVPVIGQTQAGPRTPWGDPDLQGTYTNTYENGTPFERPDEFAGRKLEDVKGDELTAIKRAQQQRTIAAFLGPEHAPTTGGRTISISIAAARRGSSSIRRTARSRR